VYYYFYYPTKQYCNTSPIEMSESTEEQLLAATLQEISSLGNLHFDHKPREGMEYIPIGDLDILRYNTGAQRLTENNRANEEFLWIESYLCNLIQDLSRPLAAVEDYSLIDRRDRLQDKAYHGLELLRRQKEIDWHNQRDHKKVIDTGMILLATL
jgi:hypothetical protein